MIPISECLLGEDFHEYDQKAADRKKQFHADGKRFLKALAGAVGLPSGGYKVRSNLSGIAGSGEVILDSDRIFVQLSESCIFGDGGIDILFRTAEDEHGRSGANHFSTMRRINTESAQNSFVLKCRSLAEPIAA